MSRHDRQLDELRDLCRTDGAARAVDLAFEHFACFGPDGNVIVMLADVIARTEPAPHVRRRFAELRAAYDVAVGPC